MNETEGPFREGQTEAEVLSAHILIAVVATLTVVAAGATVLGIASIPFSILFAFCALVWSSGRWSPAPGLTPRAVLAIAALGLHFAEELTTGFAEAFPALFGVNWSVERFVGFNVAWLIVFAVSVWLAARGVQVGFLGLVFLALGAGVANGLAHAALSFATGRVFPGAYTAPVVLGAGLALWLRLRAGRDTMG
jgi:hypothetical protein